MSMAKGGFSAVIEGESYISIGKVAELVGKSVQTIRLWSDWSDEQEEKGLPRYIPAAVRLGVNGVRCFKESDVPKIKEFGETMKYGTLSRYNRRQWGERGNIKVDKSIERRM